MQRRSASLAAILLWAATVTEAGDESGIPPLMRELDRIRETHNVPAFALTLVAGDHLSYAGARGVADRASGRPATPDSLFRIGSITKTFNGLAFLMLAEEGRLDLSAPLKTLVPDAPLSNPWGPTHPVRLVQLLEHTAGLLDLTRAEFAYNEPFAELRAALDFRPRARVIHWPPGRHSSYSNAGAGIAAYALERVTGQRYEEFMTRRVLRPLGMRRAGLVLDETTGARLATGYDSDGTTVVPYWHMIFPALGAINATPREMAALVVLLINRGVYRGRRLLSAASVVRMESPRTTLAARSGLRYGYGLGNEQFSHAGFLFHGHGGDGDGYLSHFAYQTDLARGYFITINAFNRKALRVMKAAVLDYLVADQQPPKAGVAALPAETLATFTGTYRPVTWRFPWEQRGADREAGLEVVLLGGRLHLRYPSGRRRPLLPVTDRHFRFPDEPVATLAFVSADDGLFLQGDIGNYRRTRRRPESSCGQAIGVGHQQAGATPPH